MKFLGKQWSKREAQILAAVCSTVGMVGDLQGIAGKAMPEIPSLDMPLLEASTDPEAKKYQALGRLPRSLPKKWVSWLLLVKLSKTLASPGGGRHGVWIDFLIGGDLLPLIAGVRGS